MLKTAWVSEFFFPLNNDREHYMKDDHRSYMRNSFAIAQRKPERNSGALYQLS